MVKDNGVAGKGACMYCGGTLDYNYKCSCREYNEYNEYKNNKGEIMTNDVIIEGLNISAMQRNFTQLKDAVKAQGEVIALQKKVLRIAFDRIESLNQKVAMKEGSMAGIMNDFYNKWGKK